MAGNEIEAGQGADLITVDKIQTSVPAAPDMDVIDSNISVGGRTDGQEGRPVEKDGWYTKGDVEIGLINPPAGEGDPQQQYCYKVWADGEDPDSVQTVLFDGTNPPVISQDGIWNVTVWLEDEAGNRSEEITKTIKLDTTVPDAFARTKNFTVRNKKAQKAEVKLTDAVSGVRRDSIKVLFEGKEMPVTVTEKDGVYTCDFEVEKGGIYTVQCTDEAGNKKEFAVTATAVTAEIECSEGIFGTADREELLGAVDLSVYNKGECVELNMRLEAREESGIPKDVRDGMSRKAGKQARFYYFDLAFKKSVTVGGQTVEEAVKVTDKEVTVTILIPEALRGKYNYQILRESEGNYEILQGQVSKDGTKITFATDKSSTCALTCTDKKTVAEDVKEVVQTGDPTESTGWLGLMMGMAVGIGLLLRRRIKK